MIPGGTRIEVTDESAAFEVVWNKYVAYSVMNESFAAADEQERFTGNRIRLYSKSRFMDCVARASFACDEYPGPTQHIAVLVRHGGHDAAEIDHLLNAESGLKGVSGISGDMREILAAVDRGHERARLALDVYVHRMCREIGGMVASLGGLDALVFTAGIGENCAPLRRRVCEQLAFLGIQLDGAANSAPKLDADVALPESKVRVLVIATDEDWEIARQVAGICCDTGSR